MKNIYSTNKVIYHPILVDAFVKRKSHKLNPHFVQLMPQNLCNQSCHFCSYRLENWHNSQEFNDRVHIPLDKMFEIINDLVNMSVKAVEITGGGEPLAYPYIKDILKSFAKTSIETSLVTNATLLTDEVADLLFKTNLKWVRVSIDSGSKETYCKVRRVKSFHWYRAWEGVKRLVERIQNSEQVIGLGYVITDQNWEEVLQFCKLAKQIGVHSVRISVAFTPKGSDILQKEEVESCKLLLNEAMKLNTENFQITNLFSERLENQSHIQDYDYCGTKDLLCVIEGEQKVYTCCSLTGDPHGLVGSIKDKSFSQLWYEKSDWRKNFDVRKNCQCFCLYEKRNQTFLQLQNPPNHLNFI